jgi:beta-xylosidase
MGPETVSEARRMMEETGIGSAELIITDWNNTIANRDYLNDSGFRAAYLVSDAIRLRDQANLVCVMTGSDWISYYLDTAAVVYGGIGLLTKDTIRKPAYYAFEFLDRLGGLVLSQGEDYILTRSAGGDYYLLCHYLAVPEEKSMPVEEGAEPDLALLHMDDKPSHELSFRLAGIPEQGSYYIKKRTLSSSGSILDEWGNFQFAEELSADDIRYLRERCIPEIRLSRQFVGQAQELSFNVKMRPEDVVLLHIYRG